MAVIGTIPDPADAGKTLDVNQITWCKATYGKLVYDVQVSGKRFQLDLDENTTLTEKLGKINVAYASIVAEEAAAALKEPTVTMEIPTKDVDTIKTAVENSTTTTLMAVSTTDAVTVKSVIDAKGTTTLMAVPTTDVATVKDVVGSTGTKVLMAVPVEKAAGIKDVIDGKADVTTKVPK